jgi:CRP/FNR family transcriptional regulator
MVIARTQPFVIEPMASGTRCGLCEARSDSLCSAIEECDLVRLAAIAVPMRVEPGRCFIEEGDVAEHFFNVTGGTVKLFKLLPDGRRQITGFAGRGHFLGLAVSSSYAFSAEAVDQVQLCRFSRAKLRILLDDFPAMEKRLLEVAASELAAAQEQMLLLGRKTARERLASFLMGRALVADGEMTARIHLPMTRSDIADYLGLTIETVSRMLSRFKAERLIEIHGSSDIVIRNAAALETLATGMT